MIHGRVIERVRSEADSAKNVASPVHVEIYGSVTAPGPVDHRHCCTTNNKDSTHNVQGRARHLSLAEGVQGRAHDTQYARPYSGRNPADIFLARWSYDYYDPSELRITRVVCGYGSCVRNDGYYVYRIRVMEHTAVRNAFDYITKDVNVWRWRSMLLYKREMQNGVSKIFVKLI